MQKNTTKYPNLKQIEHFVWRQLQETFSVVMKKLLEDLDQQIAQEKTETDFWINGKPI
ncbi:hypothetical protein [Amphibacillus sediminis]|uniref:hypothetical protein n=1 Tax=Amphibacillus sediminis TaxID=360185 RepID=UPI00248193BE|nr:hypothetical protein [Amphibacillus sediminis]